MKVLVTGAAGFIGSHTAQRLLDRGDAVIGLDNLNDYYAVSLKQARLARLAKASAFRFEQVDLADRQAVPALFLREKFDRVVHLGAQAGVRYSLENPLAYVDSNVIGTTNVLEGCRHTAVAHLVYASTSSVYGANTKMPFSVHDSAEHPLSFYAATKKATELMARGVVLTWRFFCLLRIFWRVYRSTFLIMVVTSVISPMWTISSAALWRR